MKNKKGLTLIEVVVALTVFMIVVVMAYPIIINAAQANYHSKKKLETQEMGTYVTENLLYVASGIDDFTFLSDRLLNTGLCSDVDPSSNVCNDTIDIGPFSRFDLAVEVYFIKVYENKEIKLRFIEQDDPYSKDHLLNIEVSYLDDANASNPKVVTKYQTVEYLRYGK
ncbi:MAG: prepilin-type N-terminal cleavage/methylation domain-containing protein [Erysipelothrix sp.]|nr:prepilin-type N-terminal cleavage/methylation domain-containing protein [Erysipelothrix sp.]